MEDIVKEGMAVMNLVEGVWWPCLLTNIGISSKPFTVCFFNEETIVQCRRKDIIIWNEETARSNLEKLKQKRGIDKYLIKKFESDCEIAKIMVSQATGTETRDDNSATGTEPRDEDSATGTGTRDEDSPTGTETREENSANGTEPRNEDSPTGTETREENSANGTEPRNEDSPTGTETRDMAKLSKHLQKEMLYLNLDKDASSQITFRKAVELVQTRLLVYNKRRSGELEAMTLTNYHSRSRGLDPADEALMGQEMSDLEKYLVRSQELIKIRGKVSRVVPVLVPEEAIKPLEFITDPEVRSQSNINETNNYVFANTGASVVRSYDSLKSVCEAAKLSAPDRITSINMRKYMATMSQVVDMKPHEVEWLCNHLGHTADVHKLHYRSTSRFIERVNIGKLMLMTDLNVVSKFAGRKLKDVTLTDMLGVKVLGEGSLSSSALVPLQPTDVDQEQSADIQGQSTDADGGPHECDEELEDAVPDSIDDFPPKKKRKVIRKKWTDEEEEEELKKLFDYNFKYKKCPRMETCTTAISKSRAHDGVIHTRNWETIKKKVANMIAKIK